MKKGYIILGRKKAQNEDNHPIKNNICLPNMELSVEDQKIRKDHLTYLLRKIHQPNQKVIPVWWGNQTQKHSNGYDNKYRLNNCRKFVPKNFVCVNSIRGFHPGNFLFLSLVNK